MTSEKENILINKFYEETGKHAIWGDRITKQYKEWKRSQINSLKIEKIFSKLKDIEHRLSVLENHLFPSSKKTISKEVSQEHFLRILRVVYDSCEKKLGDFIPISDLTEKIKEYLPLTTDSIHEHLYELFMEYEIDLQPGKNTFGGKPLVQDGKTFVWFKFKN
ncbi:MAG: hypothetical protein ACTSU4_00100 [Promethearchaeota archaeon]